MYMGNYSSKLNIGYEIQNYDDVDDDDDDDHNLHKYFFFGGQLRIKTKMID